MDRKDILDKLASGELSAEEATNLLNNPAPEPAKEAPKAVEIQVEVEEVPKPKTHLSGKWFRIQITNDATGESKASVSIPLDFLNWGLMLASRFVPELQGMQAKDLTGMMSEIGSGTLVEIKNDEKQESIKIFVE